jgi:hypothetical protein
MVIQAWDSIILNSSMSICSWLWMLEYLLHRAGKVKTHRAMQRRERPLAA